MISTASDGVILDVRVVPRSSKAGLAGRQGEVLRVRLHAPPVEGAANAELIDVLAEAFGLSRHQVSIVGGERSRSKRVRLAGIDEARVRQRLGPHGL